MDHSTRFYLHSWIRAHKKMFKSRMILILLLTVNFTNSTILSLDVFGPESMASLMVFLVNISCVLLAILGIYHCRAALLVPNIMLSSACLFYGLQLADTNDYSSVCHFIWLLISLVAFIWEIQAMFTATFGILKEINARALSRPPPSYNQVVLDELEPPSYSDAVLMLEKKGTEVKMLDVESLEGISIQQL